MNVLRRLFGLAPMTGGYPAPVLPEMDYERYWEFRAARPLPPRVCAITELLCPNSSVLDIGCGDGELYSYATRKVDSLDWFGLDVSTIALEKARKKGMRCMQADITRPGFEVPDQYDYIVITEVLEHILNPEQVLRKVASRFRLALILTIPNIAYYKHRWRMLTGRFPIQWQWHPSEHVRYWSFTDFGATLEALGFARYCMLTTNGFPFENASEPGWHRAWPNMLAEGAVFYIPAPASGAAGVEA